MRRCDASDQEQAGHSLKAGVITPRIMGAENSESDLGRCILASNHHPYTGDG